MLSVSTEDSNIFSFSVSQCWPGTMTMGSPRLQWLLMRTSPIVDFHNKWLNGEFHILKVWFILFYIYIWQVISSNRNGPHMRCLTVMDPWLSSALDMRSSYEEHLMVVTKIETKCQAKKLFFISLQISQCDWLLFVILPFYLDLLVEVGDIPGRRWIQDEDCIFKCPRVGLSGDKCPVCLL